VEAFRTQKETIKAQYSAAEASTKIGEAVTGISEQMADVSLMVDRAQEKTTQMQARAAAIDQLVDSGTLDQIGAGSSDDIQRQLDASSTSSNVDQQLALMKAQMAGQLPAGAVARIQGDDQYRLSEADRATLDGYDKELVATINSGDEDSFKGKLTELLSFVRSKGTKLGSETMTKSDVILPADDMSLAEAKDIMAAPPAG